MNEMYKTIIEQYEKDGYAPAKKSFMDLVNADRSDDEKDDVILSYITMAKLAFVNKDNEMAEKLLRLDNKFANSSEKSQLDSKADETKQESSANVINVLGIEFVELTHFTGELIHFKKDVTNVEELIHFVENLPHFVYVSRKTISTHSAESNMSYEEARYFCDNLSERYPPYHFRLPTREEFLNIIKCHKEKGIRLKPQSVYEWTSTIDHCSKRYIYYVAHNSEDGRKCAGDGNFDTTFRVIAELKH